MLVKFETVFEMSRVDLNWRACSKPCEERACVGKNKRKDQAILTSHKFQYRRTMSDSTVDNICGGAGAVLAAATLSTRSARQPGSLFVLSLLTPDKVL